MLKCKNRNNEGITGKTKKSDSEINVYGHVHRLFEICRQIDNLRQELERHLRSLLPEAEPELFFNDDRRRIYWNNGSIKLGKKSYLFIQTLWQGKNHQAEFAELEESVWMQDPEMEAFVARRTVSTLVQHTQKNLTEAYFPYKVESIKDISNRQLEGFRLVPAD